MNESAIESDLVKFFQMGQFFASFPSKFSYTTNHMWAVPVRALPGKIVDCSDTVYRFGLTAYAVRLLQDVYFIDWIISPPLSVKKRQNVGSIESKKAESDLFAPASGIIRCVNQNALLDPSVINSSTYDRGWLLEMQICDPDDLLPVDQYLIHLDAAWILAQKTIKGQS